MASFGLVFFFVWGGGFGMQGYGFYRWVWDFVILGFGLRESGIALRVGRELVQCGRRKKVPCCGVQCSTKKRGFPRLLSMWARQMLY